MAVGFHGMIGCHYFDVPANHLGCGWWSVDRKVVVEVESVHGRMRPCGVHCGSCLIWDLLEGRDEASSIVPVSCLGGIKQAHPWAPSHASDLFLGMLRGS